MYPIEKLPVDSLLYVQNRKRSFLSCSVKIAMLFAPGHNRAAFFVQKTWRRSFARTARAVKRCDRFIITGKSVLYFKSSGKVKSK